jgi:hypothetical protein
VHEEYRVDTVTGQVDRPSGIEMGGSTRQAVQATFGVIRSFPRATANRPPQDGTGIARPVLFSTTTTPKIEAPARTVVTGRTILALRGPR